MGRCPIAHDKTLKPQLPFEKVVDYVAVLAGIAVVDLLVGAHDGANPGSHRVGEWPVIVSAQSDIRGLSTRGLP